VSFFRSLKAAYNAAADNWMLSNKGRRITVFEVAAIFGQAYMRSASIDKAVVGFQLTGLWPCNDAVFQHEDFVAAQLTDEPMPSAEHTAQQEQVQCESMHLLQFFYSRECLQIVLFC